jgi:hypothetical protein
MMSKPYRTLRKRIIAALGAALLGGVALQAAAQPVPVTAQTFWCVRKVPGSRADRRFVTNLLQEARAQLLLARLVQAREGESRALDTARQAAATWSTLQGRLTAIAIAVHAPVRGSLSAMERGTFQRLGRLSSSQFQAAYLRDVRVADANALDRMDRMENARNSRVRRFVAFAHPLVTHVSDMAL